jgi:hypothetical protein
MLDGSVFQFVGSVGVEMVEDFAINWVGTWKTFISRTPAGITSSFAIFMLPFAVLLVDN